MDINEKIIKNETIFFRSIIADINTTHNNEEKNIKVIYISYIYNIIYYTMGKN